MVGGYLCFVLLGQRFEITAAARSPGGGSTALGPLLAVGRCCAWTLVSESLTLASLEVYLGHFQPSLRECDAEVAEWIAAA